MNNGERIMNKDVMTGKALKDDELSFQHNYRAYALVFEISGGRRAVVWTINQPDMIRVYSNSGHVIVRDDKTGKVSMEGKVIQHNQNTTEQTFWRRFVLGECPKRLFHNEFGSKGVKVVKFLNWVECDCSNNTYTPHYNGYFLRLDISKNKNDEVASFSNLWNIKEHEWLPHKPVITTTAEENEKVIA